MLGSSVSKVERYALACYDICAVGLLCLLYVECRTVSHVVHDTVDTFCHLPQSADSADDTFQCCPHIRDEVLRELLPVADIIRIDLTSHVAYETVVHAVEVFAVIASVSRSKTRIVHQRGTHILVKAIDYESRRVLA